MASKKAECVKVVVRCRPLNKMEIDQGHVTIVNMDVRRGVVEVKNPNVGQSEMPKTFTFDAVYDANSKQKDLYLETFEPLVSSVLDGFNGTIFAYGQTGTGKTFTMQGVKDNIEMRGVIPNSFEQIFDAINCSKNCQYLVRASYLEIYREDIRDLLAKDQSRRLELKERPDTGVYVKDLSSFVCKNVNEIDHVMNIGNQNRSVGATNMNEHSSRSHAIFIVTIECCEPSEDGEAHIRVGKLNMVDLAGSERQSKTGATGDRLKEATKINMSLSALGNCISALVDGKSTHIPYRDSKLTRLLQDSLGGNAKTVMVANVGPASYNFDETVTTLRYANRAKNIKNRPTINEDPKDALLREFQEEIARLKAHLAGKGGGGAGGGKKKKKNRRKRINEDGEEEYYDSEGGDDADPADAESEFLRQQQEKLEQEKMRIENDKSLIAGEKEQLLGELSGKKDKLDKDRAAADALQAKIKAMESKLLSGGGDILDHTKQQKADLEKKRKEIARKEAEEREIEQRLQHEEENKLETQDTYESLQAEVDLKTKKLRKIFAKLQQAKEEIQDLKEEHRNEIQELEETHNMLIKEKKLKTLIVENFIKQDDRDKLNARARYDEEKDCYVLEDTHGDISQATCRRPVSAHGFKRPMCEYSKIAATMSANPRYRRENIIVLELDLPTRTTRDYEAPQVAPQVQAALDAALKDEADLEIDSSNLNSAALFSRQRKPRDDVKARKSAAASRKLASAKNEELFPTSKGLVKR